jgi:toxin ParE1/3/4
VVVEKIKLSTRNLLTHPLSGRVIPEANNKTIREVFIYDYRLIYEVLASRHTVVVLAVFHGRRDMAAALSERLD